MPLPTQSVREPLLLALMATITSNAALKKDSIMTLPPYERAVLIIKKYETLHRPCHWPTIGYGHVVQHGEGFSRRQLSEREADALLRRDLNKMIASFRDFGRDAILLGVLSYNIGPVAVKKSSVVRMLKRGERNIHNTYASHCHYRSKIHRQLHQRRLPELALLYVP